MRCICKIVVQIFAYVKNFLYIIGNKFEKELVLRSLKYFTYQTEFFISETKFSGCWKRTSFFFPKGWSSGNQSVELSTSGLGTFMRTVEFGQGHVRRDPDMQVPRWHFNRPYGRMIVSGRDGEVSDERKQKRILIYATIHQLWLSHNFRRLSLTKGCILEDIEHSFRPTTPFLTE